MLEKLSEQEIEFTEAFYDATCMAECMFSDYDNMSMMEDEKLAHLRMGQIPLLSHEYMLDSEDPNLDLKENFHRRKAAGDLYCFSGRLFGKTLCIEKIDMMISFVLLGAEKCGFSSYDHFHIKGVLEDIGIALENHSFYKMLGARVTRTPNYRFVFNSGYVLESVNMNIKGKSPGCVDKETEVLTDDGWKFFSDLNVKDKVVSLDTKTLEGKECKIKEIIKYKYDGYLKKFKSRTSEFLFTPNHNFLVQSKTLDENKYDFRQIEKLPKQVYFPSTFKWNGKKYKYQIFQGYSNHKKIKFEIEKEHWLRFCAWYLSEGTLIKSRGHYRISFTQKNNNKELEDCFNKCGFYFNKRHIKDRQIYVYLINNKLVYLHLKKYFGQKKQKHIAKYVKRLDSTLLRIFTDEYILGDGNKYMQNGKYESVCIFTSVKKLADGLQEVAQKAGYKTHLKKKYQTINFNGHTYENYLMYYIYLCRSKSTVFKRDLIEDVYYNDFVYCVNTEPHHNIFIRRNGAVTWTGNSSFYQKHFTRLYIEECSLETNEVYEKRRDSVSEIGCIFRIAGMTNFTMHSVCGKKYNDLSLKTWVLNLPQYVNPNWDEEAKEKAIEDFGGEQSMGYRIYIEGKIVTDGLSVFDMDRVRKNYNEKKYIKTFEVSKIQFPMFDSILSPVNRPKSVEKCYISSDIGTSAPTEIIVIFQTGEKYKYEYNITLRNLTTIEQFKIFHWLGQKLEVNFLALDTTGGEGRAIIESLEEVIPKENLISVHFSEKLPVGFLTDNEGKQIYKNGKPAIREEYVIEWSIQHLKKILYEVDIELPMDHKFDSQVSQIIATQSGARTIYKCTAKENHLFQSFQVFSISLWYNKFNLIQPVSDKKFCKSGA